MKTLTVFKWFWADQDQEQEAWLREMAQRGLHLQEVDMLWRYTFLSGPASDTVYRMDARVASRKADYRQLMEDAGWQLATTSDNWSYWRQSAVAGRPMEIFSDVESRLAQYKLVMFMYAGGLLAIMPAFHLLSTRSTLSTPVKIGLVALYVPGLAASLYRMLRLGRRIRQLRRS